MNIRILAFVCLLILTMAPITASVIQYDKPVERPIGDLDDWILWQQVFSDNQDEFFFGSFVSLWGDTLLISSSDFETGTVYVFEKNETVWEQQGTIKNLDGYFLQLDLWNDTALISDSTDDIYIYIRNGTSWEQQAHFHNPINDTEIYGYGLAIENDTAVIGNAVDDTHGEYAGAVYVLTKTGQSWAHTETLFSSDLEASDFFGYSLSMNGDTIFIGAPNDDDKGNNTGAVYEFIRTNNTWHQHSKLYARDPHDHDEFGNSVSSSDSTLIAGGNHHQEGTSIGFVDVFNRTDTGWNHQTTLISPIANDGFGNDLAVSENTLLIGAFSEADSVSGKAYIYIQNETGWILQSTLKPPEDDKEFFGFSVDLQNNTAVGSLPNSSWEDSSAYLFIKKPGLTVTLTGGFGIHALIKNNKNSSIQGEWAITVHGGLLKQINKTKNGSFDIPIGDTQHVKTGLFFGLGPITITAQAGEETVTATGTQFLLWTTINESP